ncbi:MAG: hypothetical protein M3O50_17105, partial [Myxococcota bacterium]|nr:hypothetical protein [Myxococcota bacterium]
TGGGSAGAGAGVVVCAAAGAPRSAVPKPITKLSVNARIECSLPFQSLYRVVEDSFFVVADPLGPDEARRSMSGLCPVARRLVACACMVAAEGSARLRQMRSVRELLVR